MKNCLTTSKRNKQKMLLNVQEPFLEKELIRKKKVKNDQLNENQNYKQSGLELKMPKSGGGKIKPFQE